MPRRRAIQEKKLQAPGWEPHETVLIRSLRAEDSDWIQDQLAELVTGDTGKNATMQMKLGTTRRLTMMRAVTSWTFTDEGGNPLLLTEQNLRGLALEDADYIYTEINKLNQPMSEEEKKASSQTANAG